MLRDALFDEKARTDPTENSGLEPMFEFLDRVATPFFAQVRDALNRWVAAYPSTERDELISRMRAGSSAFRDAFWELWLSTAYVGAGFDVEIHPMIPGTGNQPDFAVSRGPFAAYLEARVATGASADSVARDNLKLGLYKAFNTADHRDFRLSLSIPTEGPSQPSAKALRRGVLGWLDTLEVDTVARDGQPFPSHVEKISGWTFRFTALPLSAERRGVSRAPLLSILPGGSFVGIAHDPPRGRGADKTRMPTSTRVLFLSAAKKVSQGFLAAILASGAFAAPSFAGIGRF
jgi:hypothetical protein